MELVLISENDILESLNTELTQSPEDLLMCIEDALESGELTIDEAVQLIHDLNTR